MALRAPALVAALLLLAGCQAKGVDRAPYLQAPASDAVTVVWRSETDTIGRVRFGTDPARLDGVAESPRRARHHEVRLAGLAPSARYHYAVEDEHGRVGGGSFRTSPAPGATEPVRLWILGDTGAGTGAQRMVRDAMRRATADRPPDRILHLGDLAYPDGTDHQLSANFLAVYREDLAGIPVFPVFGNHEAFGSDAAAGTGPYFDAFGLPRAGESGGLGSGNEAWYSFDHGPVHVAVLDSTSALVHHAAPMLRWLRSDLEASRAPWLVVALHHPPYSKGGHDSDDPEDSGGRMQLVRELVVPLVEELGVDLVLAGHSHAYERTGLVDGAHDTPTTAAGHVLDGGPGPYRKPAVRTPHAGTVYVVAGHGGASTKKPRPHPLTIVRDGEHGSLLLDADGSRLTVRSIRADGTVADAFAIVK